MKNTNTAFRLAKILVSLPVKLRSLPVFYEDCDCGDGIHPVNSFYPVKDIKGNIYLHPVEGSYKTSEIVEEYNRLKKVNEEIRKQVDVACTNGIELVHHSGTPCGWDDCVLKKGVVKARRQFNPKENIFDAMLITEYYRNTIKKGNEHRFFEVGYPGDRDMLPFNLDNIRINMTVVDVAERPPCSLLPAYIYFKLHFEVMIDWTPDLTYWKWKDVRCNTYKHRDLYMFDDTLTLETITFTFL